MNREPKAFAQLKPEELARLRARADAWFDSLSEEQKDSLIRQVVPRLAEETRQWMGKRAAKERVS